MLIKDILYDKGLKRQINEDSYIVDKKNNFALVSDGMGGHEKGEIASDIIANEFYKQLSQVAIKTESSEFKTNIIDVLDISNKNSSSQIIQYANDNNIKTTIGATVAGIYYCKYFEQIVVFHLGDSRVYQIRNKNILQLTNDHSHNDLKYKNILLKAIGNFNTFDMDISFINYEKNDLYLICSDGVTNFISDDEMLNIINTNSHNYCDIIKEKIYKNGAKDNLTLLVAQIL